MRGCRELSFNNSRDIPSEETPRDKFLFPCVFSFFRAPSSSAFFPFSSRFVPGLFRRFFPAACGPVAA